MLTGPPVIRTMFLVGLLFVAAAGGVWWQIDRIAAEKIATSLTMPCGVLWYLLICLMFVAWKHAHRRVVQLLACVLLAYTIIGNGLVSYHLTKSLEEPFFRIRPLDQEPCDVVLVLGGGAGVAPNGRIQGNSGGDRVILAAELYKAGIAKKLACTGTRIPSIDTIAMDISERTRRALAALGVPDSAMIELSGRNTSEEMMSAREHFGDESRIGVVTSAWHMKRTLRLAEKQGLELQPFAGDFLSGPTKPMTPAEVIQAMIPQAGAMNTTTRMLREYLGILAGR